MLTNAEVTGGFTLASAILSVIAMSLLNQRAEGKRRSHELKLHESDQSHDHRERLQDVRLASYQDFTTRFSNYRRAYRVLGDAWATSQVWTSKIKDSDETNQKQIFDTIDDARKLCLGASSEAVVAWHGLEDSLGILALVATEGVAMRAKELMDLGKGAWAAKRDLYPSDGSSVEISPEKWMRLQDSERKLDEGIMMLLDAVRVELGTGSD